MEIKSTFTVDGETFETEQAAMNYVYYLERKAKVSSLMETLFKERNFNDVAQAYHYQWIDQLSEYIVKDPEIFRKALDIVDGK